jgi:MFS family permease
LFVTQTWLLGPLKRRFGDARLVIMGTLLRSVSLVIFAVSRSPWPAVFGSLVFSLGQGVMMPPLQSLATQTEPESVRGGVLGIYQSSASLATIMSTAIAGAIFAVNPTIPYWIAGAFSLAVVVPGLILLRMARENRFGDGSGVAKSY